MIHIPHKIILHELNYCLQDLGRVWRDPQFDLSCCLLVLHAYPGEWLTGLG